MASFNKSNHTESECYSESFYSDCEYFHNEDLLDLDAEMERLQLSEQAYSKFGQVKAEACARAERKQLKAQQNADYEASKELDRAKMEERARLTKEKRDAEEALTREVANAKRRQENLAASLPAEPDAKDKNAVTIKLRFPDNTQVIRRFYLHEPLQLLVDFAGSCGYFDEKYRMFTSDFPRKNVATLDKSVPFTALKWYRREQVIVEEI